MLVGPRRSLASGSIRPELSSSRVATTDTVKSPARLRSPTPALLVGLVIILVTVAAYSWYVSGRSRDCAGCRPN